MGTIKSTYLPSVTVWQQVNDDHYKWQISFNEIAKLMEKLNEPFHLNRMNAVFFRWLNLSFVHTKLWSFGNYRYVYWMQYHNKQTNTLLHFWVNVTYDAFKKLWTHCEDPRIDVAKWDYETFEQSVHKSLLSQTSFCPDQKNVSIE